MTVTQPKKRANSKVNGQMVKEPLDRLSQYEMKDFLVAKCEVLERGYCSIGKRFYFVFYNRVTSKEELVVVSRGDLVRLKKYFYENGYKKQPEFIEEILKAPSRHRVTGKVSPSNTKPAGQIP